MAWDFISLLKYVQRQKTTMDATNPSVECSGRLLFVDELHLLLRISDLLLVFCAAQLDLKCLDHGAGETTVSKFGVSVSSL